MPARSPIDGEDPYSIDDIRRDVPLLAEEVSDTVRHRTLNLLSLAELLESSHTGQTLTGEPTTITYELARRGDDVDLLAYFNITGDYEVMVCLDNQYSQVAVALVTTFDVDTLWFNSRVSALLEPGSDLIGIESAREVALFEWDESLDMSASLDHAVEQAEHLVIKSIIASLAVTRERV